MLHEYSGFTILQLRLIIIKHRAQLKSSTDVALGFNQKEMAHYMIAIRGARSRPANFWNVLSGKFPLRQRIYMLLNNSMNS
ncbi:MAG TPA: hypothetical protein VI934_03755, partial [Candidatus Nanoarchaeia archaeon]|nr:hypothetical protein [Candidatus Nanoarchaeia archaeon]